ncbi:ENTH/VHS/GAT family protein [Euphorbia peplus]|nr:ENTH/VHS/GAT family protein [Euphorbia peplus]
MPNYNSNTRVTNGSSVNGDQLSSSAVPSGPKNFIPSYRLFEDLNVFGNTDGRFNPSASLSGASSQGMVGGRK